MRLTEYASTGASHKVNRDDGIIESVKVLGFQSRNGYRYSEKAVRDAAPMYEGTAVYIDHWRDSTDRPTRDHFGQLKSVRFVESKGLFADLHYLTSHPESAVIVERAEKMPDKFGLSHDADGSRSNDLQDPVIESINRVYSVDVVARPATNESLFESETPESSPMKKKTIVQLLKEHRQTSKTRERLYEMAMDPAVPEETAVEVEDDESPEDQLKKGLLAAINKKLENASPEELQNVLEVFGMEDSLSGAMGGGDSGGESSEGGDDAEVKESLRQLQRKVALSETKAELLEANVKFDNSLIETLAELPTAKRTRLIEAMPKNAGGNDRYRPERSPSRFKESNSNENTGTDYERLVEAAGGVNRWKN